MDRLRSRLPSVRTTQIADMLSASSLSAKMRAKGLAGPFALLMAPPEPDDDGETPA